MGGHSGKDWLADADADDETAKDIKYPSVKSTRCTALPPGTFAHAILSEPCNVHGRSAEARYADGYVQSFRACGLAMGEVQDNVFLASSSVSLCEKGSAAEATAVSSMQRDFFRRIDDFEFSSESLMPLSSESGLQKGCEDSSNDGSDTESEQDEDTDAPAGSRWASDHWG